VTRSRPASSEKNHDTWSPRSGAVALPVHAVQSRCPGQCGAQAAARAGRRRPRLASEARARCRGPGAHARALASGVRFHRIRCFNGIDLTDSNLMASRRPYHGHGGAVAAPARACKKFFGVLTGPPSNSPKSFGGNSIRPQSQRGDHLRGAVSASQSYALKSGSLVRC
jgi:hypothetical protein